MKNPVNGSPKAPPRAAVAPATELKVLTKARRRCCLCFGFNADLTEKPGQIAHVDQNRSNNKLDNLAFLCLPHHDKYDGKTSQSKGITQAELKHYRTALHRAVAGGIPTNAQIPSDADRERYTKVVLRFKSFIYWIERHPWQSQFHINLLDPMVECLDEACPPDEEFRNPELRRVYRKFYKALETFNDYLETHSDPNGMMQTTRPYTKVSKARYGEVIEALERKAAATVVAYRNFVAAAKVRFDV